MQQNTKPFLSLDGKKPLKFTSGKMKDGQKIDIVFEHDDQENNVLFSGKLTRDIATGFFYTQKADIIPFALKVQLQDGNITDINQLSEIDDNAIYESQFPSSFSKVTSYKKFASLTADYQGQKNKLTREAIDEQVRLLEQGGGTNIQANPVVRQGQGNQQVQQSSNVKPSGSTHKIHSLQINNSIQINNKYKVISNFNNSNKKHKCDIVINNNIYYSKI